MCDVRMLWRDLVPIEQYPRVELGRRGSAGEWRPMIYFGR